MQKLLYNEINVQIQHHMLLLKNMSFNLFSQKNNEISTNKVKRKSIFEYTFRINVYTIILIFMILIFIQMLTSLIENFIQEAIEARYLI